MPKRKDERPGDVRLIANQLVTLSALLQRAELSGKLGKQFGGDRDLYTVLGYRKILGFQDYWAKYQRQDIAGRIVDAPAAATWRRPPQVTDDDNSSEETQFEKAFNALSRRLRLWHNLDRADRLAGVGRYAILLIGVRDGKTLADPVQGAVRPDDVLYLQAYSEGAASINSWVTDTQDPAFGKPETYRVDLAGELKASKTLTLRSQIVHRSRVIHVADGLLEDNVYGMPRLKRVFNRLDDLEKLVGGSAEMFWQGAYRGLVLSLREGFDTGTLDEDALRDKVSEFVHGLRRWLFAEGYDAKTLESVVADPKGPVAAVIDLISGATGIPQRILLGSERGELASTQDETNWLSRVAERQTSYAEPLVLRPLIDRFIEWGALPMPKGGEYLCNWPTLFQLDEVKRAEVAERFSRAISQYVTSGGETVVPVSEFREKVLGLEPEMPDDPLSEEEPLDEDDDEVQEQFRERGGQRRAG